MSARTQARFRLLDPLVGWDAAEVDGLDGVEPPGPLSLAPIEPGRVDAEGLASRLPPPWLARGHRWFMLDRRGALRRLVLDDAVSMDLAADAPTRPARCVEAWRLAGGASAGLRRPAALAARGHLVAVADPGAAGVVVFAREGAQRMAHLPVGEPGALFIDTTGVVWVVDDLTRRLRRFTVGGRALGQAAPPLPPGKVTRVAIDSTGVPWIVIEGDGPTLWRAPASAPGWQRAALADLHAAVPGGALRRAGPWGACLEVCHPDGGRVAWCFDRAGAPIEPATVPPPTPQARAPQGGLLTTAIDSGIPRCRWHRIRVDADVPRGTRIALGVASAADPAAMPDPADWWSAPGDGLDVLIDQPPGRYLFVRVELFGDGVATPRVRRVRLDLPRVTSFAHLPGVYATDARAEDFTERLLALFDSAVEDVDQIIERFPALLDVPGVSAAALPWLAGFLDLTFDPAWSVARQRTVLQALPALYRRRGTPEGLRRAIELATGFTPLIVEPVGAPPWGALRHGARLGGVRLFGRHRHRFRVGRSGLGRAPLRSFGDGDQDPHLALAHRVEVSLPSAAARLGAERLRQLVEAQLPAHVRGTVRVGAGAFTLGHGAVVGIDTTLGTVPPPVLGATRLSRALVLWPGRRGRAVGVQLDGFARLGGGARL